MYGSQRHEVHRLVLPSDPTYWVELKGRLTAQDQIAAQQALVRASMDAGVNAQNSGRLNVAAYIHADELVKVLRSILSWNVDMPDGSIQLINEDSVGELEWEDFQAISKRVDELNRPRSPEERLNFRPGGGRSSAGDAQDGTSDAGEVPAGESLV